MSDDSSEEKALPASDRKLQEERKKGRIAQGRDMVVGVSMAILLLYAVFAWPSIKDSFGRLFEEAARAAAATRGMDVWPAAARAAWRETAAIVAPFLIIGLLAAFGGSLIANRGMVVSAHPLKPDLKRISMAAGFKRLFSIRSLIELVKSLLKTGLLLAVLAVAGYAGLSEAMRAPVCGAACVGRAFMGALAPMAMAAAALFFVSGLVDLGVQRWLFLRDMRMTHTEMKRERKEMFGDPAVAGRRREIRRESQNSESGAAKGLRSRAPTMMILGHDGLAVGLRYARGETAAPVIVAMGRGAQGRMLAQDAASSAVPVVTQPDLAALLARRGRVGRFVPEQSFGDIARILTQRGMVRARG